ncbi:MAG: helix-turn-helix transcriptional regulator [Myxococcales bacterium]|nr:helix-turn-helix transcriptional regulator [Myxococcales bacterium]
MAVDPDEFHARIATQIRLRAEKKGLKLRALAQRVGTSSSHLWAVLGGRRSPTMAWLCRVADVLGCDPAALIRRPRRRP